ncbi:MAG: ATP-binding protein [Chloroflexota bacterium]|nr:ATP-binding protein [Chloroflexota bacterium]
MVQDQQSEELSELRGRLGRFLLSSIRNKIILPYLVLTLIIAVMGIYVVTRLVVSSLDERLTNQLLEAGRVVSDSVVGQELEHLESARAIAFTVGLADALQDGDQSRVVALAQPVASVQGVECLILVDHNGQEVLHVLRQGDGSYESAEGQFDTSGLWIVQALIEANDPNGSPKRGIVFHPANQRYYYFTALPVGREEDDSMAGVVIAGTSLDTLLPYFKTTSLADVIVYLDGGHAVATTFALAGQPNEVEALLDEFSITPSSYEGILYSTGITAGESIQVRGRSYRLARGPLRVGDDGLGVFAVALPLNLVIEGHLTSRNNYALVFLLGMASVILVGYLISRRITSPISRLVRTSQAVAEGNLDQRTGIVGADEIGILAGTFDEMTVRLSERTHALEETLGRMRAILSSMGDGVMMEDMDGNLISLNTAADAMLEEMAKNFMFGPLRDLSTASDQDASDQPSPWLLDHRRFEVGTKVISVHSATVRTDEGEQLGTVIVMRDVTAEVAAERLKDNFITHVSHELRTPLTAIKGYSDLLLSGAGGDLGEGQRNFIETIGHNTDDLVAMVNELIDFSEIEAKGRLGLLKHPTRLSALVEDVAEDWRPRMDEKELEFQVEIPADLPIVDADSRRLRWAIIHLVRNALQYTPAGGSVTLRLSGQDDQVVLDIIDTGIGISSEDLEHLFSRFHRVTNMPEDDVRGLGVGLYLAMAIVEAHGGDINVVSVEGSGSTFSVILPVSSNNEDSE